MKKCQKVISLLLTAFMLIFLVACGSGTLPPSSSTNYEENSNASETENGASRATDDTSFTAPSHENSKPLESETVAQSSNPAPTTNSTDVKPLNSTPTTNSADTQPSNSTPATKPVESKPAATEKVLNVPKLTEKTVTANKTSVLTYTDSLASASQKKEYNYTAKESGRVRFEINELRSGILLKLYIYDRLGEIVEFSDACSNNDGITLKVEKGDTYKIVISSRDGFGSYKFNIWQPKAPICIDNCSKVKDSIEFVEQRNIYTFNAPIDGTYKFYITELKSNEHVSIYLINHLDEVVKRSDYVSNNTNGIVAKLEKGESYKIQVIHCTYGNNNGISSYTFNVGKQKETKEISGYSKVNDCIEYLDQVNYYSFTVPDNGTYSFKMTEMKSVLKYNVSIYNYLDEKIVSDSYAANGDELLLKNVKKGDKYTICITNVDSSSERAVGSYTLALKKQ